MKDEKLFNFYKSNKDNKIITLIQKVIIHYLLFLFEDINSQMEEYNNDKIFKNHRHIFQTEIFKFMSIPINDPIKN